MVCLPNTLNMYSAFKDTFSERVIFQPLKLTLLSETCDVTMQQKCNIPVIFMVLIFLNKRLIMTRQLMVVLYNDNGFFRLNRDINGLICKLTMLDNSMRKPNKRHLRLVISGWYELSYSLKQKFEFFRAA